MTDEARSNRRPLVALAALAPGCGASAPLACSSERPSRRSAGGPRRRGSTRSRSAVAWTRRRCAASLAAARIAASPRARAAPCCATTTRSRLKALPRERSSRSSHTVLDCRRRPPADRRASSLASIARSSGVDVGALVNGSTSTGIIQRSTCRRSSPACSRDIELGDTHRRLVPPNIASRRARLRGCRPSAADGGSRA